MSYKGVAKGKTIELQEWLPYPAGQLLNISVEPFNERTIEGLPAAIRQVMDDLPHLRCEDVDKLEQVIEEGKLPVCQEGVFDGRSRR